jgi:PIN domain nuclease of toxin-antitoxin system
MTIFVLDTSAILTILNQEEGVETVLSLLAQTKEGQATIHLPFMALMELEYLLLRRLNPEETR